MHEYSIIHEINGEKNTRNKKKKTEKSEIISSGCVTKQKYFIYRELQAVKYLFITYV